MNTTASPHVIQRSSHRMGTDTIVGLPEMAGLVSLCIDTDDARRMMVLTVPPVGRGTVDEFGPAAIAMILQGS